MFDDIDVAKILIRRKIGNDFLFDWATTILFALSMFPPNRIESIIYFTGLCRTVQQSGKRFSFLVCQFRQEHRGLREHPLYNQRRIRFYQG